MKYLSIIFLIIFLSWILAPVVYAASPEHDFDDCSTDGTDIVTDCNTGGTGWSGNWTSGGTGDYVSETTNCQSSNCTENDDGGDTGHYRTAAETSAGSGSFYVRKNGGNVNTFALAICDSGTTGECTTLFPAGDDPKFEFRFTPAEAVLLAYSGGTDNLGTADSTHRLVEFEWGDSGTCSSGQVRARFDGGSYSACRTMITSLGNDPGGITLGTDDTAGQTDTVQIDEFSMSETADEAAATRTPPLWIFVPLMIQFFPKND